MTNDEFYDRVAERLGVESVAVERAIRTVEALDQVQESLRKTIDAKTRAAIEEEIAGQVSLRREIECGREGR